MRSGTTGPAGHSHKHTHRYVIMPSGKGKTTSTIIDPKAQHAARSHTHSITSSSIGLAVGHPHDAPGGHKHSLVEVKHKSFMAIPKSYKKKAAAAMVYAAKGGAKVGDKMALMVAAMEKKLGRKLTSKELADLKAKLGGKVAPRRLAARAMRSGAPVLPQGYSAGMAAKK